MSDLGEARRVAPPPKVGARLALTFSSIWRADGPEADAIARRVRALVAHHQNGAPLRGKDKRSGAPFDAHGIRHSHVHERRPDPVIFYQVFVASDDKPGRLHFIAVSTHANAFGNNAAAFLNYIQQQLGESAPV